MVAYAPPLLAPVDAPAVSPAPLSIASPAASGAPAARAHYTTNSQRLHAVLEITRLLAAEVELSRLLPLAARKTCEALDADRASVFLVDHERQELHTVAVSELEIAEIRLPLGAGLAGHAARSGDVLNIPDCYRDPRFDRSWDQRTGYRTRSMLVMPMWGREGHVIGVFQVINKLTPDGSLQSVRGRQPRFTQDDVEYLDSIAASCAIALQNALLVAETRRMFTSTVAALAATIDARDAQTAGHSARVAAIATILARRLGLPPDEVEQIHFAGLLHDFGKVAVRDAILTKPGSLTEEERRHVNDHVRHTQAILGKVRFLRGFERVPLIAAQHHEKLDGSGYPQGHRGDEITLGGRILAVADSYDALRTRRYYKPAYPVEQALTILREEATAGRLDAAIVIALESCLDDVEQAAEPLRPTAAGEGASEQDHPLAA